MGRMMRAFSSWMVVRHEGNININATGWYVLQAK